MTPIEKAAEWLRGCSNSDTHPEDCAECTNALILSLANDLRKAAAQKGPMQSYWDEISDMEDFANGKSSRQQKTARGWIENALDLLDNAI